MTDEQLNKRLHEILRLCWHEWNKSIYQNTWICSHCGLHTDSLPVNTDFVNTWQGFGILWEFIQKHEKWDDFLEWVDESFCDFAISIKYINPPTFAKAVGKFFEEEK